MADKFFIILAGSVVVYRERQVYELDQEFRLHGLLTDYYRKNIISGAAAKIEDIIKFIPEIEGYSKQIALERLDTVDALKITYNKRFLAGVLKSSLSEKQFAEAPGFFDHRGILLMNYIGILNVGMSFGEKGLDEKILRTATVICDTPCHFGVIYKDDYDQILKQVSIFQAETQRRFFYDVVFNRNVPPAISERIAYDFNKFEMRVPVKSIIYKQETDTDYVYVIEKGSVLIYREEKYEKTVGEDLKVSQASIKLHKLALLGSGAMFGMEDISRKGRKRFYSAVAMAPTKLLRITKECFNMHLANEPLFGEFIKEKHIAISKHRAKILEMQGSKTSSLALSARPSISKKDEIFAVKSALAGLIFKKDISRNQPILTKFKESATAIVDVKLLNKSEEKPKCAQLRRLLGKKIHDDMSKYAKLSLALSKKKTTLQEREIARSQENMRNETEVNQQLRDWTESLVKDKTFLLKSHLERMKRSYLREVHEEEAKKQLTTRTSGLKCSQSFLAHCKEKATQRMSMSSSTDVYHASFRVRRLSGIDDERKATSAMKSSQPSFHLDFRKVSNNQSSDEHSKKTSSTISKFRFDRKKTPDSYRNSFHQRSSASTLIQPQATRLLVDSARSFLQ